MSPTGDSRGLIFNIQKFALHDGDGIRTCVFFQGCNMRCGWCANPESLSEYPDSHGSGAKFYTVAELVTELLKDKPFYDATGGGVTLTGGEPLLQPQFAISLCDALREAGVGTAMETSANADPQVFQRVLHKCDLVFIDLKHYDDEAHRLGTGVGNALVISNIGVALASSVRTIIRIPLIPGFNNALEDIRGFASMLRQLNAGEVQLVPFHQMGEGKYRQLGMRYDYAGVAQLHDEDAEPFAQFLTEMGFRVQIGG